jgi:hypothetical protein
MLGKKALVNFYLRHFRMRPMDENRKTVDKKEWTRECDSLACVTCY